MSTGGGEGTCLPVWWCVFGLMSLEGQAGSLVCALKEKEGWVGGWGWVGEGSWRLVMRCWEMMSWGKVV